MGKPKVRFKGYTDDWEQRKVGEVTKELSEYDNLASGLPLLTSSRNGLMYQSDYRGNVTTENENTLFSVVPVNACTYRHMSDDSTFHLNINTLEKGLVSREYPVFQETKSNLKFIVQYINSSNTFTKFCTEQKKGGTRTRLYYKTLCEYQLMIPPIKEQDKIADFFDGLDRLITLHQRKYENLQKLKKYMLQKMFPQNGTNVPEIRFEGFQDAWEQRKLGEVIREISTGKSVNSNDGIVRADDIGVLKTSCVSYDHFDPSESKPVVKNEQQLVKCVVEEDSVIVSRMNTPERVGACGYVAKSFPNLFLPDRLWKLKFQENIDAYFIYTMLVSSIYKEKIISMASGTSGSMYNIPKDTFLNLPLTLSLNIDEQTKIGNYFKELDHLITLHQHKCEELKNIKKFMLQNMFVQEK